MLVVQFMPTWPLQRQIFKKWLYTEQTWMCPNTVSWQLKTWTFSNILQMMRIMARYCLCSKAPHSSHETRPECKSPKNPLGPSLSRFYGSCACLCIEHVLTCVLFRVSHSVMYFSTRTPYVYYSMTTISTCDCMGFNNQSTLPCVEQSSLVPWLLKRSWFDSSKRFMINFLHAHLGELWSQFYDTEIGQCSSSCWLTNGCKSGAQPECLVHVACGKGCKNTATCFF